MKRSKRPERQKLHKEGGKWIPILCTTVGIFLLFLVMISCFPLIAARMSGYEVYNVVSGSMEPEIPVGSAVYVKAAEPGEIAEGDVIAFHRGDFVVVHRVVENRRQQREFVTRGDANAAEDLYAAGYGELIGRVERHFPVLGSLLILYTGKEGKACAVCLAGCGALLNLVAGRLREQKGTEAKVP